MRETKKAKCPRCGSQRIDERLGGDKFCKRCGQRWAANGLLTPSFDRRTLSKKGKPAPAQEQLLLVKLQQ
jgi:hypothetical protein